MLRKKQQKLGQVFLKNKLIINKIIKAGEISQKDLILEIGPGKGALTQALLETKAQIIAIEKDFQLIQFLQERFKNYSNFKLIQGDIRDFLKNKNKIPNTQYKVIGNIPYYLTSYLIQLLLELETKPKDIILMIQKEVAQRIIAQPPKMNLLAVSVQLYAQPKIITYVPKTAFSPVPKVDSAIIKITPYPIKIINKKLKSLTPRYFFKITKASFGQPRKLLINNLVSNLNIKKQDIELIFQKLNFPLQTRAQELSIEQWVALSLLLEKNKL